MQIIPAIDLIDGKCVRLTEGDYAQKKIYNEDPLEVAKAFEGIGLMRLHLVDLDGAKAGSVVNWKVLEKIANQTKLKIDFGGGIKKESTLKSVLEAGASYATIGSLAVKNRNMFEEWIERFGAAVFMLGADVFEEKIVIGGWIEKTDIDVYAFMQSYIDKGLKQMFCTDIQKDGKLEGPSIDLYKKMISKFSNLELIASGGVSKMKDLIELRTIGCAAAIVGKAIYENRISLEELSTFQDIK
jgi:phosphoribosylformimino-5-aminoimidazole carboxamide ribotide isomerase